MEAVFSLGKAVIRRMSAVSSLDQPRIKRRHGLGPHTRGARLLEGITRQGQTLIAARAELTAHVGGTQAARAGVMVGRLA
jgi:hypothetical protein